MDRSERRRRAKAARAEGRIPLTEQEREELLRRYNELAHAVQTGIAFLIENGDTLATPKHLRVGLDMRAADAGALGRLLISKGVITEREYLTAMVEGAAMEAHSYAEAVQKKLGRRVTLA